MSLQSEIDLHVVTQKSRTVVIVGETGDGVIPSQTYVELRDCTVGNLDIGAGSTVLILGSTVTGEVTQDSGGALTMDRTTVTSAGKIVVTGCRVTQKLCTLNGPIELYGASLLDAYANEHSIAPVALSVREGSVAELREDTFDNVGICLDLKSAAKVSLRQVEMAATGTVAVLEGGSTLESFGGAFQSTGTCVFLVQDGSTARFVRPAVVDQAVSEVLFDVDGGSTLEISECGNLSSTELGISVKGASTFILRQFGNLEAQLSAIFATEGSKVELRNGGDISSVDGHAVWLDAAELSGIDLGLLSTELKEILRLDNTSTEGLRTILRLKGIGELSSSTKYPVVSGANNCTVEIEDCPLVLSEVSYAFLFGSGLQMRLRSVAEIDGFTLAGIEVGDDAVIDLSMITRLEGHEGAGLSTGANSKLTMSGVTQTTGGGRGIDMGSNSHLRMNGGSVKGVDFDGIRVGSGSTVELSDFGSIQTGETAEQFRAAIYGDSNVRVILKSGTAVEVLGTADKLGILLGSGGYLYAQDITTIRGGASPAIQVDGGKAEILGVGSISGNTGVKLTAGSYGTFQGVGSYGGGEYGVRAVGSTAIVSGGALSGSLGAAAAQEGGHLSVTGATLSGTSVLADDGSYVEAVGCTCSGDVLVAGGAASLRACTISGGVTVTTSGAVTLEACAVTGAVTLTDSTAHAVQTTAASWSVTTSSALLVGSTGTVTYVSGTVLQMDGAGNLLTWANYTSIKNTTAFETVYT